MDKELLEYLENMTEQEQEIIKNNRPVLSYFTKAEGSTVIDSDVVMKPITRIEIMKQPSVVPSPDHTHTYMEIVYMCSG